ncbi:hypothetical protein MITSMUL_04074 [Mitsuokella multacida DSM 20544]|uniref:Uncharacterized protein n=1 Tax=Mitsuokella multacida DSM 20544 TaxID=500635 RepID=C9KLJ0_9FIRM|nr:hypothetical protein MITSMUL_04074 [Mitsuokella multacida DSM 20544]
MRCCEILQDIRCIPQFSDAIIQSIQIHSLSCSSSYPIGLDFTLP